MDVRVVLQLPAPGVQDPGEPRQVCPDEPLIGGEPFEGERRGVEHGLVREALMRADEGSERLRHGEGEEEVRPGKLLFEVVFKPLLGFMLLTLGAVAVATGMIDAVVFPTAGALIEAVAVVAALTVLDGQPTPHKPPQPRAARCPTCGAPMRVVMRVWTSPKDFIDTS